MLQYEIFSDVHISNRPYFPVESVDEISFGNRSRRHLVKLRAIILTVFYNAHYSQAKCIVLTAVCVCVCLYLAAYHYCTDTDVTLGNGRGCPLVVQYWICLLYTSDAADE